MGVASRPGGHFSGRQRDTAYPPCLAFHSVTCDSVLAMTEDRQTTGSVTFFRARFQGYRVFNLDLLAFSVASCKNPTIRNTTYVGNLTSSESSVCRPVCLSWHLIPEVQFPGPLKNSQAHVIPLTHRVVRPHKACTEASSATLPVMLAIKPSRADKIKISGNVSMLVAPPHVDPVL